MFGGGVAADFYISSKRTGVKDSGNPIKAWAPPLILPCRTTHKRFFPKVHSFSYSYLFVGVPVEWKGSMNGMIGVEDALATEKLALSVSLQRFFFNRHDPYKRPWLRVDAQDYLMRGHGELGLRGKLNKYLKSENVNPADFPHAYLVTAPRFWDYQFNPVSFWYLYSSEHVLSAMILEVNNTFDERRMYFLRPSLNPESSTTTPAFRQSWQKDFHVSPFNDREGEYSLRAYASFHPTALSIESTSNRLDNTITLRDRTGKTKLIARIHSQGPPLDPSVMSMLAKAHFVLSWSFVGLRTFPRIVYEAGRLFFLRRLRVWFRPEVLSPSVGRRATPQEVLLEKIFRAYLTQQCRSFSPSLSIIYTTPSYDSVLGDANADLAQKAEKLRFSALTPAFFSRFVHYTSTNTAIAAEALTPVTENRTLDLSQPSLVASLMSAPLLDTSSSSSPTIPLVTAPKPSLAGHLIPLLSLLRTGKPPVTAYPTAATNLPPTPPPLQTLHELPHLPRALSLSHLDTFVRSCCPLSIQWVYLWLTFDELATAKIFVSPSILLKALDIVGRVGFVAFTISCLERLGYGQICGLWMILQATLLLAYFLGRSWISVKWRRCTEEVRQLGEL